MKNLNLIFISLLIFGCQHSPKRFPSSEYLLKPKMSLEDVSKVSNQHTLIVTHATTEFDSEKQAAEGIDQIVREFKAKGRPVVYLVSDQSESGYQKWYTADRTPDYEVFSEGGEHNLPINTNEVTIIGGFFGSTDTLNGCHALSVKDAIRMHFEVSQAPLTINIPIKATYFYSEWENIREALLKDGKIDLRKLEMGKYPFSSLLFLREGNQGMGDDGNEQNFAHFYTGKENKNYRAGEEVSRDKYQFRFYVNGKIIESITGPGKRIVHLKMTTH